MSNNQQQQLNRDNLTEREKRAGVGDFSIDNTMAQTTSHVGTSAMNLSTYSNDNVWTIPTYDKSVDELDLQRVREGAYDKENKKENK
ncbi:hypothetical protein ABK040_015878 [Willaertia magna]